MCRGRRDARTNQTCPMSRSPLPSTHDLDELIEGLRKKGLDVAPEIAEAVILNSYSAEARYPSLSEPVTTEEYHEAVRLAEAVVTWAEKKSQNDSIAFEIKSPQSRYTMVSIFEIVHHPSFFNPPDHHMVDCSGTIQLRLPRHFVSTSDFVLSSNSR